MLQWAPASATWPPAKSQKGPHRTREVARDANAASVCFPEETTAGDSASVAGLPEQKHSAGFVLRDATPLRVEAPEDGACGHVSTVAGLPAEQRGAGIVLRDAIPVRVGHCEVEAGQVRASRAATLKEGDVSGGIP